MRDAHRGITIGDRIDEDAEAVDIGKLLESDRVALHLPPDRIGLFLPALDLDLDAAPRELVLQLVGDTGDQRAVLRLQPFEPVDDELVGVRHQIAEREVLQLVAQALHAHAAGQRRVDIERVLRNPRAPVLWHELQGSHVVQAVGEFDQQHAHVVGDREQQFAEILRLLRVPGGEVELVELGQSIDETADLRPEHLVDLIAGDGRVLDRVVQHRRDDRGVVELELGEDRGDLERMREIGVPRGSLLLAMRAHREDIGAIQQLLVRLRIVTADTLDQFILTHHLMGWTSRRREGRIDFPRK